MHRARAHSQAVHPRSPPWREAQAAGLELIRRSGSVGTAWSSHGLRHRDRHAQPIHAASRMRVELKWSCKGRVVTGRERETKSLRRSEGEEEQATRHFFCRISIPRSSTLPPGPGRMCLYHMTTLLAWDWSRVGQLTHAGQSELSLWHRLEF